MKKVSFAALVVALTSTTFAATADNVPAHCPKAFQGFFLGGNVGLGTGNVTQTSTTTVVTENGTPNGFTDTISTRNRLGVRGFDGGLNTGYNHRFGNFGLGLEFVANWTNAKGSHTTTTPDVITRQTARLNNSLQLRGNFSYVIANLVAPKIIVGWDSSKWKQTAQTTLVFAPNTTNRTFAANKSKYLNAFLVGAGVDFLATKHFIIGMDATVSLFNKSSINRAFGVDRPVGIRNANIRASSKPHPYTKISLVMKFIY